MQVFLYLASNLLPLHSSSLNCLFSGLKNSSTGSPITYSQSQYIYFRFMVMSTILSFSFLCSQISQSISLALGNSSLFLKSLFQPMIMRKLSVFTDNIKVLLHFSFTLYAVMYLCMYCVR